MGPFTFAPSLFSHAFKYFSGNRTLAGIIGKQTVGPQLTYNYGGKKPHLIKSEEAHGSHYPDHLYTCQIRQLANNIITTVAAVVGGVTVLMINDIIKYINDFIHGSVKPPKIWPSVSWFGSRV